MLWKSTPSLPGADRPRCIRPGGHVPGPEAAHRPEELVPTPARAEFQCLDAELRGQAGSQRHGALLQTLQVVLPTAGQRFAGFSQFVIPGIQHPRRATLLEQGIALFQCPRIPAPQGQEIRFHVEQAPIEESAAGFTTTADQRMAAWLECDYRKRCAQIAELGHVFAVQAPLPILTTVPKAGFRRCGG